MNAKLSVRAILIAALVAILHSFAFSQVDKIVSFGTSNENYPKISSQFYVLEGNTPIDVLSSELSLRNSFGNADFEFIAGNASVEPVANDFVFCMSLSESMQSKQQLIRDSWQHYLTLLDDNGSQSAVVGYSESLILLSDFSDDKTKLTTALNDLPFSNTEDISNLILKGNSYPLLGNLIANRERKASVILVFDEFYDDLPNFELDDLIAADVAYYVIVLNGFASDNYKKLCQLTGGTYFEKISDAENFQNALSGISLHAAGFEPNEISFYDKSCTKIASVMLSHSGINSEINYLTLNKHKAGFAFAKGTSINFGIVKSPQIRRDSLFLTAKNADLKVFNMAIDLPFRIVNKPATPFTILKDSTLKLEIEYAPTDTAYKYGQVRIQSDLCDETILHLAGGSVFSPNFVKTLKILQPNGGESLFAGSNYDIKWEGILPTDEVTIDHTFDNGNFWNTIGIGDQMSFNWNPVPSRINDQNKIRLRHLSKEGSTKKIVRLNGLNNRVVSLQWNQQSTQLFTAGQDGFIRIWDPAKADPLATIASGLFSIIDMDLSFDDQYVAHISRNDSVIHIIRLDIETKTTLSYNNEIISKIDWHPTKLQLLAATESGQLIIFDAISRSVIKVYTPDNSRANDAKWSPKGDLIVAGYSSGNIAICYLADDSVAVLKNSDAKVNSVSINASGMTLSVASDLETISIWNLSTQSIVLNMQNTSKNVMITSWDPKLKYVATTSLDSTISLWEPATGMVKHRFNYHSNIVSTFEWSYDGNKIASGTIDGEVLIWSPDDLPFENQFTQIDISDNTFSIILPNVETAILDFGALYYKDRVDGNFIKNIVFENALINRNSATIKIDSIAVKYNVNPIDNFKAIYRFSNYFPIELAKDENLELFAQLKTNSKDVNRKADTLLYYTSAGVFKSVLRYGIGKQILLSTSDIIDFGKVPLGDSTSLSIRIRNLSDEFDYTINSIADFIPETNDFDFSELIGTTILKNNFRDINLKFLPKVSGKTSKLLVTEVSENNNVIENLTYDFELHGEGIAPALAFSGGYMDEIKVLCDDSIGRKEIFIYNIGNHELQIKNITIENNPNNKFQLELSATNFLVPIGDSTSFIVIYESMEIKFDQAQILVETNITNEWKTIHTKNILGRRELSEFEFSQNKLRFLVDDVNISQTRTFQLRNTGTIPIFWTLPESNGLFVVESIFPMNTLPNDSSEVTVTFLGSQTLGYFDTKFDFRDTCHNIQSLIVDAYVGPNSAQIQILDFLNLPDLICDAQSPEYAIEITNTGGTPLFIDNIYFSNGDIADFTIVSLPASDRIDAGNEGIVRIIFAPQTPGIKKTYLAIESNATNSVEGINLIEINAFAGHIEIELTPSPLFFESLIQNKEYHETTTINNKSNIPIFWEYPIESTHFSIDSIIPQMSAPGGSSTLFVTFKGGTTGNNYTQKFNFDLPCDYELSLELFADVRRLASTGIKAGNISAKPGDTVMLPLYLYSPSDVGLPQTQGYKTQLRFNSKIMYPLTEDKGTLDGNYRILEIVLPANPIDGETAIEIPFLATLGDTTDTEIRIQNSVAISSEEISIEEVSGYFSLDSLCLEGGVRLVANTGVFNLLQNYPNPAAEITTFKFSAIERGIHKLVIVDITGAFVALVFEAELEPGLFEVSFNVSRFAMGNYIYRLIGPNLELNKKMTILR
ncbi:MAG: choice-of-anchor D domain-containing protein [Candidatus Kapabacteria bacterium]|nr:choice-of-anchor D domain-containing protein [Candidatus Kapabacteria bacterium]